MTIDELIEGFELFDDWEERYRFIIDLGRKLEPFNEADRIDLHRVQGCISNVWVISSSTEDRLVFRADSDSHIVRGLIAILLLAFSDKSPADILKVDIDQIFEELGLARHLSPNRRNGFFSMVERIKGVASAA